MTLRSLRRDGRAVRVGWFWNWHNGIVLLLQLLELLVGRYWLLWGRCQLCLDRRWRWRCESPVN